MHHPSLPIRENLFAEAHGRLFGVFKLPCRLSIRWPELIGYFTGASPEVIKFYPHRLFLRATYSVNVGYIHVHCDDSVRTTEMYSEQKLFSSCAPLASANTLSPSVKLERSTTLVMLLFLSFLSLVHHFMNKLPCAVLTLGKQIAHQESCHPNPYLLSPLSLPT